MKNIILKTGWLAVIGSAAMLATGCKTIIRENVISSIDTGFGATIMENKETQVPEIKVGYIRSQFYSVPTGKVVENADDDDCKCTNGVAHPYTDHQTNAANLTPEMVAGIRVESGWKVGLFDANISENFALGSAAVQSQAAVAMYIADAKTDKAAIEAAKAVNPVAMERARVLIINQDLAADEVIKKVYSSDGQINKDQLKKAIKGTAVEDQFESISKLNKTAFSKRLNGIWSDLAIEMKDNLNQ